MKKKQEWATPDDPLMSPNFTAWRLDQSRKQLYGRHTPSLWKLLTPDMNSPALGALSISELQPVMALTGKKGSETREH